MKIIFKVVFFISAIVVSNSAIAQNDYVITVKGDSVSCKVSIPVFGGVKYKSGTMNTSEKIKPDEIKEYYIARKTTLWRSVFIDSASEPVFMTVVEKGKINLFELVTSIYNGRTTTSTVTWYVSKGSDYVSDLKTSSLFSNKARKQRKDDFAEMLADNKEVYNKYKSEDKFTFVQIRNLVHLYNTGLPFKAMDENPADDHPYNFNPNH